METKYISEFIKYTKNIKEQLRTINYVEYGNLINDYFENFKILEHKLKTQVNNLCDEINNENKKTEENENKESIIIII